MTVILRRDITINCVKLNFLLFINIKIKIVFTFNHNNKFNNIFYFQQKTISIDFFNFKLTKISNSKINIISFDNNSNSLSLNQIYKQQIKTRSIRSFINLINFFDKTTILLLSIFGLKVFNLIIKIEIFNNQLKLISGKKRTTIRKIRR